MTKPTLDESDSEEEAAFAAKGNNPPYFDAEKPAAYSAAREGMEDLAPVDVRHEPGLWGLRRFVVFSQRVFSYALFYVL